MIAMSFNYCWPETGITPSCTINPRRFASAHSSAILPSSILKISMPVIVIGLPVGGRFIKIPLCIPWAVNLAVTLSPSAIRSSTVTLRCSKAARHVVMISFIPWIPGADGSGVCTEKLGIRSLFAAARSPFDGPNSKNLQTMALFSSIDMYCSSIQHRLGFLERKMVPRFRRPSSS
jgi:hypothetical protein